MTGSDLTLIGLFAFAFRRPAGLLTFSPLVASLVIWDALPIVGVALALAVCRGQARARWLVGVYAAWLAFLSAMTGFGVYRAFVTLRSYPCLDGCGDPNVTYHSQLAWGIWLSLGALLLAWVAFGALWLRRTPPNAAVGAAQDSATGTVARPPRRAFSRAYMLGVGVFTLGAVAWTVGLFVVPWVTVGCVGIPLSFAHFSHGSCMGLDGYDMLIAGLNHAAWIRALGTLTVEEVALRSMELLAVAGAVAVWWLWTPWRARYARAEALAAVVWLLLVTLMFIIGWQGTARNLGQPAQLVFGAQGTWGVGPGVWLAAVGLALAAVGCMVAWVAGGRGGILPSVATPPTGDDHGDVHRLHTIG